VVYDPGWDMPRQNWLQQGSFETGEIPLAYDPDAEPLICLPPINRYWLPLILGCLDQLRNPSTWIASSDSALNTILDRSNRLMQMVGERADCVSCPLLRLNDCVLESSCDGGTTWVAAAGWADNFANCVSNVIIPPIPPNPGPSPIDQHACNIAGYIAAEILQASITKAVNDYNTGRTQLQFANDVLQDIAFAFPLTALAVDAFVLLYNEYTALTIGDFTTASTDPVLWGDVTCAIYSAIRTTGYIDAANLPTVVSNICAISYTSSTVITAICNFVSALQLSDWQGFQNVGALDDVDCSGCASPPSSWCWTWDFTGSTNGWGFSQGAYVPADHQIEGNNLGAYYVIDGAIAFPSAATLTKITVDWYAGCAMGGFSRIFSTNALTNIENVPDTGTGFFHSIVPYPHTQSDLRVVLQSSPCGVNTNAMTRISIYGTGTRPAFTTGASCPP
jgi:hypothetical protein